VSQNGQQINDLSASLGSLQQMMIWQNGLLREKLQQITGLQARIASLELRVTGLEIGMASLRVRMQALNDVQIAIHLN
jgi:hypothetical protein